MKLLLTLLFCYLVAAMKLPVEIQIIMLKKTIAQNNDIPWNQMVRASVLRNVSNMWRSIVDTELRIDHQTQENWMNELLDREYSVDDQQLMNVWKLIMKMDRFSPFTEPNYSDLYLKGLKWLTLHSVSMHPITRNHCSKLRDLINKGRKDTIVAVVKTRLHNYLYLKSDKSNVVMDIFDDFILVKMNETVLNNFETSLKIFGNESSALGQNILDKVDNKRIKSLLSTFPTINKGKFVVNSHETVKSYRNLDWQQPINVIVKDRLESYPPSVQFTLVLFIFDYELAKKWINQRVRESGPMHSIQYLSVLLDQLRTGCSFWPSSNLDRCDIYYDQLYEFLNTDTGQALLNAACSKGLNRGHDVIPVHLFLDRLYETSQYRSLDLLIHSLKWSCPVSLARFGWRYSFEVWRKLLFQ